MKRNKAMSLLLAMALLITTVFAGGPGVANAEEATNMITVYAEIKANTATTPGAVNIGKTAVRVPEGTTAETVFIQVLAQAKEEGTIDSYKITQSSYGGYLEEINGLGTQASAGGWAYWSLLYNTGYAQVGMSSLQLKDNDKISFLYSNACTPTSDFTDDATLNPTEKQAEEKIALAKKQRDVLAENIYASQFAGGQKVPGIENVNGLYSVFSLAQAGFKAPEFYDAVYQKVYTQLKALKTEGKVAVAAQDSYTGKTYDITEASILENGAASQDYAKIALAVSALGKDSSNVGGFDLIEKLVNKTIYKASSPYSRESMILFAIDSNGYELPKGSDYLTRKDLVLAQAAAVSGEIDTAIAWNCVDSAAMAVQPILSYAHNASQSAITESEEIEKVNEAADQGIHFLESMQTGQGTYTDGYVDNNPWSLAQTMLTASLAGISTCSETDGSDFIKNGNTMLDNVAEFVNVEDKTVAADLLSFQPEQLLRGLDAVLRLQEASQGEYSTKSVAYVAAEPKEEPVVTPSPVPTSPVAAPTQTPGANTPSGSAVKESVKAAKTKVVLNPGKSATVSYTVKNADGTTTDKNVTVATSNKKVATVKKQSGKVKITVPKKAVRGNSTTITIKNGSKKAKIAVFVKNPAKKVKAAKAKVSIKKGKTGKAVVTVKALNNKKAVTDTVKTGTAKSKIAKVTKTKTGKGKATVFVKALKKGSTKLTIKVGSKKVTVLLLVK